MHRHICYRRFTHHNNGYIIFQDPIFYNLLFIIYRLSVTISRVRPVIALAAGIFCFWIKCRKIFRIVWKWYPDGWNLVTYPACAPVNKKERPVKVKIADDMVIGQPLPTCLAHRCWYNLMHLRSGFVVYQSTDKRNNIIRGNFPQFGVNMGQFLIILKKQVAIICVLYLLVNFSHKSITRGVSVR